jgi:hypothetical protein
MIIGIEIFKLISRAGRLPYPWFGTPLIPLRSPFIVPQNSRIASYRIIALTVIEENCIDKSRTWVVCLQNKISHMPVDGQRYDSPDDKQKDVAIRGERVVDASA